MISEHRLVQRIYDVTWGRFVFAGAYDWLLKRSEKAGLAQLRQSVLKNAVGRTLEIGAGTGLNLSYYPSTVTELVLSEPYPPMVDLLQKKLSALGRKATIIDAAAESLPFSDATFDTVVGSMVLCSAKRTPGVLQEIARVLKPGGSYIFLEHVRHRDPAVARRQDLMHPFWYFFWNGCHCNQNTAAIIARSPLVIKEIREELLNMPLRIVETVISGRAYRSEETA